MKRSKTQLLRSLAAAMLLGTAFASCSQDDMPQTGGTPLPEGEYPLTLTARVDGMNTRATGKDAWVDGDKIGVRIGTDDATGCYELNNDGLMKNVITPVYWQNTASSTVTAWYPYEEKIDVSISDQSTGFAEYDFLTATAENQTYGSTVSLNFKHQMAKVSYTLKKGDGITDEELKEATVILMGNTTTTFVNGALTEADSENNGEITSCYDGTRKTGEALLVPQNMTDKPFIKVRINGKDFTYTPSTETAGNLQAGSHTTYTITVKKDRIEVTGIPASSWNDDITEGPAEKAIFRVYLPEGHGQDLEFSDNVRVLSDYLEVRENSFTISYAVTNENRMKGFPIADGDGEMERTMGDAVYTFTYTLRSDMKLTYGDYIQVGDYFYFDCTWRPDYVEDKTCIGIVFKVGAGDGDAASNYDNKLTAIHGYVVALKDAHDESGAWGKMGSETDIPNEESFVTKYNGYTNTRTIKALDGFTNIDVDDPMSDTYWAFKVASDYSATTPLNSSGWYLPSIGQLADIYALPDRTDRFNAANGSDFHTGDNSRYWSSTEKNSENAWLCIFSRGSYEARNKALGELQTRSRSYVRAVLTF